MDFQTVMSLIAKHIPNVDVFAAVELANAISGTDKRRDWDRASLVAEISNDNEVMHLIRTSASIIPPVKAVRSKYKDLDGDPVALRLAKEAVESITNTF